MKGSYRIENHSIYEKGKTCALSRNDVFDLIDEGFAGDSVLISIDFESCSDTFSSLKTVVYTPEQNSSRHPCLDIQIIDPDYNVHHLDVAPTSAGYCVVDGLFLLLDPTQVDDFNQVFNGRHSGAIEYSLLASLYKLEKSFVEFIPDNDLWGYVKTDEN